MTDRISWIVSEFDGKIENTSDLYHLYDDYTSNWGHVSESTFRRYCRAARDLLETENDMKKETEAETIKQETILKSKKQTNSNLELALTSYSIKDIDGVIEWADVDMTKWELYSQSIRVSNNASNPWYIIDAKFRLKDSSKVTPEEYAKRFLDLVSTYKPSKQEYNIPSESVQDIMAEVCIMDFHFGQEAWGKETRDSNYNINIASTLLNNTIDYFISKTAGKVGSYTLPLGNDFFNVDNSANTTYGGTAQDEDTNFKHTHITAEELLIVQIDKLASIAPVHVVCISGNHDKDRLWYLGEFLRAWYRGSDRVTINNSPPQRKYIKWGRTVIGYTHGNNEIRNSLPLLMLEEASVDFSTIKYKEWHTGHLHAYSEKNTRVAKETYGIREIILPSLVPLDAWHSSKGYRHLNEALCFIWDKEKGKITTHYFHPEEI